MQPKSIILFFYGYILFFRRQNLGEKYLIKNDQNETFTLNKQDIFSLLDKI
ncbi:hypothetical protein ACNGJL_04255 [Campylobacter jejuni]